MLGYDADFYPYGGERSYTNTCTQNNYKFEGKERDTETLNDDFGARYYSNRFGRWLSADWSSIPTPVPYANLTNPQTLNLYAMVLDDPESFADLDGHDGNCGWWCRLKQRFQNSDNGLGFRTDAQVKAVADNMRRAAGKPGEGGELVSYNANTKTLTVYTPEQLGKLNDADAVKLFDQLFPSNAFDNGSGAAQAVAGIVTTSFGPRGFEKPVASNKELQGIVNKLYQDTDAIPGGTAGAVRHEAATGNLLSPAGHAQDAADTIKQLNNFLKNNPGLSSYDQNLAKSLIQDLTNALAGKP